MKAPELDSKFWQRLEKLLPVVIFVFALAVRLCYDLSISQHRLCSFGDGYFFLKTGQELAKALTSAAGFPDFLAKLTVHTTEVAGGVETFGSGALADRLLLDGPVYTFFLAVVHMLAGIVNTTDYAQNSTIFSVANSILDSLSCLLVFVCGRLAFGWRAGLVAALLLAVYPASILNTRLCYSELYTYFLLLLWSTVAIALFQRGEKLKRMWQFLLAFILGATTILVVLARSVFFPLPIAALAILFARKKSPGKLLPGALAMAIGAAMVMAPWLWFTHEVTGRFVPWVNRAPGYNLFVGNQLNTDGWRTWPAQPGIPNETRVALNSVSNNFREDPARFAGLFLRKVSRLWAGVWNDFRHKAFGIGWQAQNVFHDLILMFGVLGFIISLRSRETRRPAMVFGFFALFHSVYACFEPVARYAITAMPFSCLLASQALTTIPKPWRSLSFVALLACGILFFALLNMHVSFIPVWFAIVPTDMIMPVALLDAAVWIGGWLFLSTLFMRVLTPGKWWETAFVWLCCGAMLAVTVSSLVYDPANKEWHTELRQPGDRIEAEIHLPQFEGAVPPVSYLLVDMQTEVPAPAVTVSINGVQSAPAMPVLQFMQDRKDASEIFSLQAQAMNVDPRSYRHWWVFPFSAPALSFSTANKISITAKANEGTGFLPVRIFGTYPGDAEELSASRTVPENKTGSFVAIPSINKFSWVKGFVTIDRRDPRPYEGMLTRGYVSNCAFGKQGNMSTSDLSPNFGRQFGTFRMRLYLPPNTMPGQSAIDLPSESSLLFERKEESLVAGGDPSTMIINETPIEIPSDMTESGFYVLSCDLKKNRHRTVGGISVTFTQKSEQPDAKDKSGWNSPWCPATINLPGADWQRFTFMDRLPDDLLGRPDLTATIMIAPFSADKLFLHPKDAIKDTVKVRNIEFRYFNSLAPSFPAVDPKFIY